jgi:hypothetical protein
MPVEPSASAAIARGVDVSDIALPCVAELPRRADGLVDATLLWSVLAALDPSAVSDSDQLEVVAAWRVLESAAGAHRVLAAGRFAAERAPVGRVVREFADDEIALRLGQSRRQSSRDLSTAVMLERSLSTTRANACTGRLDLARVAVIADATAHLDDALARKIDAAVASAAPGLNPAMLRRKVQRAVIDVDPGGAELRHRKARADREVSATAAADGMADVYARITAPDWMAISTVLDATARGLKAVGDPRTMAQLRADALVAPFLNALRTGVLDGATPMPLASVQRRPAQIHITAPASVLAGDSQASGDLHGYGPITAGLARALAADADWRRVLLDPDTGAVLDVGRTTAQPPASLVRHLMVRDQHCRFPGCTAPATSCDLDHTVPYPLGTTSADNLGALCRRHHRMKHELPGLRLQQDDGAAFHWTTPEGRTYSVPPPDLGVGPPGVPEPEPEPHDTGPCPF